MDIADYLNQESVAVVDIMPDKGSVLREVVRLAGGNPVLDAIDAARIVSLLDKRERQGSTGFGGGIAIPHCRIKDVSDIAIGVLVVTGGVDFDSMDGGLVRLIVLVVAPERETNKYIRLLSIISQTLRDTETVEEIAGAGSPAAAREAFLRHLFGKVDSRGGEPDQLFQVLVRNEETFNRILQVFAAAESCSSAVIEAKNTREYLVRLPLFSSFWSDPPIGGVRLILATVNSSMTNMIVREIERITGDLHECRDVLVVVQNVVYTSGALYT
ncbi:PTS sugar transporter subunit IIA [candidate division KSB1 bacterium]